MDTIPLLTLVDKINLNCPTYSDAVILFENPILFRVAVGQASGFFWYVLSQVCLCADLWGGGVYIVPVRRFPFIISVLES